eukprot:Plantae.Rhodophyta-Hildenbrandia_rubra.ctg3601.p1 GENE.Plantae.Rhodophyta-Hildenbrandia_rubra.ctg3601~~Plantae.Rhodophyta-Hildenbrandia_rubra.ctg3601.p1  ORF type:complete len:283 (+),score=101.59 Plantae.Rhodophyta-Hildenbrandia_rubra.ctg3601:238-1086(+)
MADDANILPWATANNVIYGGGCTDDEMMLAHSAPETLGGVGMGSGGGWDVRYDDGFDGEEPFLDKEVGFLGLGLEGASLISDGGFSGDLFEGKVMKKDVEVGVLQAPEAIVVPEKEKPRRGRKRRYSKEEELNLFGPGAFNDLTGTTAAHSRKMTGKEREIMLHKRRLRNRESAARSREKRGKTVTELSKDYEQLAAVMEEMKSTIAKVVDECRELKEENTELKEEKWALEVRCRELGKKKNGGGGGRFGQMEDDTMSDLVLSSKVNNGVIDSTFTEAVTPS